MCLAARCPKELFPSVRTAVQGPPLMIGTASAPPLWIQRSRPARNVWGPSRTSFFYTILSICCQHGCKKRYQLLMPGTRCISPFLKPSKILERLCASASLKGCADTCRTSTHLFIVFAVFAVFDTFLIELVKFSKYMPGRFCQSCFYVEVQCLFQIHQSIASIFSA